MRITVDTAHDSHDDIKKVIRMLQHLTGDSQEVFTNNPQEAASPMANIFGDAGTSTEIAASSETQETPQATQETPESSESTEDLFAELFSEEELKKMDSNKSKEEEEEIKPKSKDKKYGIEFY